MSYKGNYDAEIILKWIQGQKSDQKEDKKQRKSICQPETLNPKTIIRSNITNKDTVSSINKSISTSTAPYPIGQAQS